MAEGRLGEAEEALDSAVRLAPGLADAWFHLGRLYAGTGRAEQAIAAMDAVLRIEPANAAAAEARARLLG